MTTSVITGHGSMWYDDWLYQRPPIRRVSQWRRVVRRKPIARSIEELRDGLQTSRAERAAKNRAACRRRDPLPILASQTTPRTVEPIITSRARGRPRSRAALGKRHPLNREDLT